MVMEYGMVEFTMNVWFFCGVFIIIWGGVLSGVCGKFESPRVGFALLKLTNCAPVTAENKSAKTTESAVTLFFISAPIKFTIRNVALKAYSSNFLD